MNLSVIEVNTTPVEDVKDALKDIQDFGKHGEFCGPNHTGTGTAIDDMDACCEVHDSCYTDEGIALEDYLECKDSGAKYKCDNALVDCLKTDVDDSGFSEVEKAYRIGAIAAFEICLNL